MGYKNVVSNYTKFRERGYGGLVKVDDMQVYLALENTQYWQEMGSILGIVFHWTAGPWSVAFDGYGDNIVYNPLTKKAHVVHCLKWSQKGSHIWGRNTGLWGISFASMKGATDIKNHMGEFPVVDEMIRVGAIYTAELCAWKGINPQGVLELTKKQAQGNSLITVPGILKAPTITDHKFFADADGYSSHRWDIGGAKGWIMESLMSQLLERYRALKDGKAKFEYLGILRSK